MIGVTALSLVLFGAAFVAAPKSCEGGIEAYLLAGVVALVALFAWPFVAIADRSLTVRSSFGLMFVVLGCAVWFGGLFAANVRIICKLF